MNDSMNNVTAMDIDNEDNTALVNGVKLPIPDHCTTALTMVDWLLTVNDDTATINALQALRNHFLELENDSTE